MSVSDQDDLIDDLSSQVAQLNQHLDSIMDYVNVDRLLINRHEQLRELYRKVGNLAIRATP